MLSREAIALSHHRLIAYHTSSMMLFTTVKPARS